MNRKGLDFIYFVVGMLITTFLVLAPIEPTFASSITTADSIQVQSNKMDKTGYVSQPKIDDAMLGNVQLPFIENIGQADDQVKYYANTFAGTVFVTENSITYSLHKGMSQDKNLQGLTIKEKFLGAQTLNPTGLQKSDNVINYFVGDKEKWKSNVPAFNDISLGKIWPAIDVSLKAHGNNIEKIFTVHPRGDVSNIKLESDGINSLQVDSDGRLLLDTQLGTISMTKPVAFQYIDGIRKDIQVSYYVEGTTYGFTLGQYDHTHDLVIDPLLASTFIGGTGDDFAREIAINSGNVYVAGYSESSNYPVTAGAYNQTHGGGPDVFVSKLDTSLGNLVASTFIGGGGIDFVYSLVVDSGNVYVAGRTESSNFPVTTGAYDQTYGGNSDAYVTKLDSSLGTLLASTFIGGSGFDGARTLAIDSGNIYVGGRTGSFDFPVTAGAYNTTPPPNFDGFVLKLDTSLSSLLASTFIGTDGNNIIYDLAVNSGNVYVTGQAISSNYPVTASAYDQTYNGGVGGDTFVSKLDTSLSSLLASTYLGGNGDDIPRSLVIDSGNVYVAGHTNSSNYPVTASAYDKTYNGADNGAPADGDGGSGDVFVSKLDTSLSSLLASTYLGGSGNDLDFALAIDSGNVYVAGTTDSFNYPVTAGAYDRTFNVGGSPEAFVSKLDTSLSSLLASTYLGGSSDDLIRTLVIDSGNVYVAGRTNSPDYPVTTGAYDQTYIGAYDTFVSKLDSCLSYGTPGVNSILITTISNSSPIWGIDSVSISGAASNAVAGDTVTVNWGDGNTTQIPISCATWGPVLHTYSISATSSNPNQIIATLVNGTNFVKATSTPSSVTIQKHTTKISVTTLNSTSVKWGKKYSVTNNVLTDITYGIPQPIAGKTITYGGNGTTGFPSGITNSTGGLTNPVTITAPGIFNVGKGNIFAKFAGDSAYLQSSSSATIQITKHATTVSNPTFSVPSVLWGKTFTVDSIIVDTDKGVPINGSPITYSGNGTVTKTDFSNSTGHAVTTLTATNTAGSGQVGAAFAGDGNYLPSNSGISVITLAKHATALTNPTFDRAFVSSGNTFNADSILTDSSNASSPVSGKQVTYSGNGTSGPTSGITNSTGHAPTTLSASSSIGADQVSAAFGGDSKYLASNSGASSITVIANAEVTSSVNNTSPRWGIDTITVSGNVTSSVGSDTITVSWGDGTNSTGIPISSNSWGPVTHTYNSGSISTNPNQVITKLVANDNSVKATSVASSVNVRKHLTALSQPTLSIGTIKWGKTFTVTATQLTDSDAGGAGLAKTITYAGTAVTGIPTGTTTSGGTLTGPVTITASTNVGTGKTIIANFTGDALYLPSTSTAASITINPHLTALSKPTLSSGTIKWSKTFTVKTTKLTDSDSGGAGILGKTIKYAGTAVTGVPTGITNSSGSITGPVTITASTNVGTGKTIIANFTGDALYLPSTSTAASITINPHVTALTIGTLKNVAWSQSTSLPITFKDSDNAGSTIQGKLIHYNGTGVIGVLDATTNSTGQAVGTGTAPTSVATGWSVQGHFAGDSLYVKSDSAVKTYNTLKHTTTTSLIITPGTVVTGQTYKVTGTLKDSTTGAVLSSKTITFTATSPIVINPATTTSTGTYSVTGLLAPSPASYTIQSQFGGDSLYSVSSSPSKTLTVTS